MKNAHTRRHRRGRGQAQGGSTELIGVLVGVGVVGLAVFWFVNQPTERPPEPREDREERSERAESEDKSLDRMKLAQESSVPPIELKKKKKRKKKRKREDKPAPVVEPTDAKTEALLNDLYAQSAKDDQWERVEFDQLKANKVTATDGGGDKRPLEPRVVSLAISGSINGKQLGGNDKFTFSRLGFAFQQLTPCYYLKFPDGSAPIIVPGGSKKKATKPKRGRIGAARYQLVLNADSNPAGGVSFYGKSLASKVRCVISGQLIDLKTTEILENFSVASEETLATDGGGNSRDVARIVYDMTLEKVARKITVFSEQYFE